jgi:hypothetical protein
VGLDEIVTPGLESRILTLIFQLMFISWMQDLRCRAQGTNISRFLHGNGRHWAERNWGIRMDFPVDINTYIQRHIGNIYTCLTL